MQDRWKTLAGGLFGGQFIAASMVHAGSPIVVAVLVANIPTAMILLVQRLTKGSV